MPGWWVDGWLVGGLDAGRRSRLRLRWPSMRPSSMPELDAGNLAAAVRDSA